MGGLSDKIEYKKCYHPIIKGNLNQLLSSTIVDASICFFSMGKPIVYENLVWEIISKGIFHHSGVILEMSDEKFVLLEYGAYPKRNELDNNENENNYYYPLGNGFRFILIDIDYISRMADENKLLLINSQKLSC